MTPDLPLWTQPPDTSGRDAALARYEVTRPAVIHALREEALAAWRQTGGPVSVNDLRAALAALGYDGDPRILGAVFTRAAGWVPEGFTMVRGSRAHARMIRTFRRVAE